MSRFSNKGRWVTTNRTMPKRINLTEVAWLVTEICAKGWVRLEHLCQLADEMKLEPEDATGDVLTALIAACPKMDAITQWERGDQLGIWMARMHRFDDGLADSTPTDRRWDVVQRIAKTRIDERFRKGLLR